MPQMEDRSHGCRFPHGKQSSLKPGQGCHPTPAAAEPPEDAAAAAAAEEPGIPDNIRLMYLASEGDVEGIEELMESGTDVNFPDVDGRTALHVAACQGLPDVVELLLRSGARVDPRDRWGSTPLADAIYYENEKVIKILDKFGAKIQVVPMLVKNARDIPEYEIDPKELDFSDSAPISKGTFRSATWRGLQVAIKMLGDEVIANEERVKAFRDELQLLQQIRHPNVVQFLGAVTQSSPMMIITEYLPEGDFFGFLKEKGAMKPSEAVNYALDIARGMNYLHEHKPAAIIHRDLEPSNILRDDSGHLKVADFGVSKLLKVAKTVKEDKPLAFQDSNYRYIAPEIILNKDYDTKVDIFSFSLILQEMIEGCSPFSEKEDHEVPKLIAAGKRPPFRASPDLYRCGIRELIEECWSDCPTTRPTFRQIIDHLSSIEKQLHRNKRWEPLIPSCFQFFGAIWKKDKSDRSSISSSSSHSK